MLLHQIYGPQTTVVISSYCCHLEPEIADIGGTTKALNDRRRVPEVKDGVRVYCTVEVEVELSVVRLAVGNVEVIDGLENGEYGIFALAGGREV